MALLSFEIHITKMKRLATKEKKVFAIYISKIYLNLAYEKNSYSSVIRGQTS